MNPNWAEENLQTIRTLMERSALYRRALAPIMLFAGTLGIVAAAIGLLFHFDEMHSFGPLWLGTAALVLVGSFFITRQQAIRADEKFWSSPTRRVAQALFPPLFSGMFIGIVYIFTGAAPSMIAAFWLFFYGCALHSAGFFMPRGIRYFGWVFIGFACVVLCVLCVLIFYFSDADINGNWLMGFFFGVLHLAYGAYLYLTEKKNPTA